MVELSWPHSHSFLKSINDSNNLYETYEAQYISEAAHLDDHPNFAKFASIMTYSNAICFDSLLELQQSFNG